MEERENRSEIPYLFSVPYLLGKKPPFYSPSLKIEPLQIFLTYTGTSDRLGRNYRPGFQRFDPGSGGTWAVLPVAGSTGQVSAKFRQF